MPYMEPQQEEHLRRVKADFLLMVDVKYRRGQAEHGGDLAKKPLLDLINAGLDEAIDQVVYLLSARDKILNGDFS